MQASWLVSVLLLSGLLLVTANSNTARDDFDLEALKTLLRLHNVTTLQEALRFLPEDMLKPQPDPYIRPLEMACPVLAVPADTSDVNQLRPGNIRVVMAMGDSVTAAMSAKDTNILSLKEYRGLSYAIGGDAGVPTLPNILKPYVPTGYPIGASTGIGKRDAATTGLNGAVSGAINSDMLGQAQWLVTQLKANKNINFQNDWKVLTIWIGSNNLCDVCDDQKNNNGANFQNETVKALEYLYTNVPRLFVNIVANLEISPMHDVDSGFCSLLHSYACPCVGSSSTNDRNIVKQTGLEYQARSTNIANLFNARKNPTFAVVVQPFLVNTLISDRSQLSAADCFHPSAGSHGTAAIALWNNMITPQAKKSTNWQYGATPLCPTADTLLYTN